MTPTKSVFVTIKPAQISVTIANSEKLKAEGIGEISILIDGQKI